MLSVKSKTCFLKSPFFLVHPAFWVCETSPFLMIICAMVTTWYMVCGHPCGHPSHTDPCDGYIINPFEHGFMTNDSMTNPFYWKTTLVLTMAHVIYII